MVIRNIKFIDSNADTAETRDLSISDDFVDKEYDGTGYYAAQGFTDMHVHVFEGGTYHGMNPDKVGIQQGVTTVVDAGSSGLDTFKAFKADVIDKSKTRVLYFLNIAKSGLGKEGKVSELADMSGLMTLEELINFQKINSEGLAGLKVRMSGSVVKQRGIEPMIYARKLSDKTGLPLMVHIGNGPPELGEILKLMKKGDILTHCFHGKKGGLLDYRKEAEDALKRGVHFDVGHGSESFSIRTAKSVVKSMDIDFSISTDIYSLNYKKPVGSLMDTMSKFLSLGFEPEQIVKKVTVLPSKVLGLHNSSKETFTIFKIVNSQKDFLDAEGNQICCDRYFAPAATIINGKCVWTNNE